jgi:hypothetical protein
MRAHLQKEKTIRGQLLRGAVAAGDGKWAMQMAKKPCGQQGQRRPGYRPNFSDEE